MASDLHDRDIREPLFEFLEDSFGKIRILEEKTMGRSRADIVMICESYLTGIEIKSDKDTYVRLASQVKDYDKYYDRNIIVVGSSHALHVEEHVPQYWGIITVEDTGEGLDFYILRAAKDNPKRDMKRKLSLLWRPELFEIQAKMDMPKYKDKSKDFVIGKILSLMSLKDEITGQTTNMGVSGYSDEVGGWYWDDRMIYHFEKYNMKLASDFTEYVLSRR